MRTITSITSILGPCILFVPLASCQTCHWPDGSVATSYLPCNGTSAQCCYNSDPKHRDICFDNGLCISMLWGGMYRGACSDPFWGPESGCASHCIDVNRSGLSPVTGCGTKMCCGSAVEESVISCCNSTEDGFFWGNSTVSNLGICPGKDPDEKGLSKSDIIAISTGAVGAVGAFIAFLAWIWPRSPGSTWFMDRLRDRLRGWIFRRNKKKGSAEDNAGGLQIPGDSASGNLNEMDHDSGLAHDQVLLSPSPRPGQSARTTETLLGQYSHRYDSLASS